MRPAPPGPTTDEGKQKSALNSFRHGLASGRLIIEGEDPQAFDALRADLVREYQPSTPTESILVQSMAQHYWLSQRAVTFQGRAFAGTDVALTTLAAFVRYQTANDRAFLRCLAQLLALRAALAKELIGFDLQKHKEALNVAKIKALEAQTKSQYARADAILRVTNHRCSTPPGPLPPKPILVAQATSSSHPPRA